VHQLHHPSQVSNPFQELDIDLVKTKLSIIKMEKQELYNIVKEVLVDFMEHYNVGEVGRMATVCSLIKQHIPDLVFAGFYLMNSDGKLEIGPY